MAIKIRPYRLASKSARVLAHRLGVKRIKNPYYRQKFRDLIVNWGNSQTFGIRNPGKILNQPDAVSKTSNKLVALKVMKTGGVALPEFTESAVEAARWLTDDYKIVARTLLNSHSGNGAIVVEPGSPVPYAPLYTRYFRRDAEYRVHVFRGQIIDYCQKKRRSNHEEIPGFNPHIRTHQFGWVYCRDSVALPETVKVNSLLAVSCLGLDFGAVDVLYRVAKNSAVVLEVNTAPGIEGTTLEKYASAISALYNI